MGLFKKEKVEGVIELGDMVRDRVSRLEGIVFGMSRCAFGTRRIVVQPREAKDGKLAETFCVEMEQFELVEKNPMKVTVPMEQFMGMDLGDEVKDRITGLSGMIVWATTWLYGCCRFTIQPRTSKDGKPAECFTIDVPQAELVKRNPLGLKREESKPAEAVKSKAKKSTGGPALSSMRCAERRF